MIPANRIGWEYSTDRWTHVVTCKESNDCFIRAYNDNGVWRCAEKGIEQAPDFGRTLTNVRVIKVRNLNGRT